MCGRCGHVHNAASHLEDETLVPKTGDISICIECTAVHVLKADNTWRMVKNEASLPKYLQEQIAEMRKVHTMSGVEASFNQERLGDAPIEEAYREQMNQLARAVNEFFNGDAPVGERKTGFVLMVFPFDSHDGRCNYISNGADRNDVVTLMKEQIARFEGQAEVKGNA